MREQGETSSRNGSTSLPIAVTPGFCVEVLKW